MVDVACARVRVREWCGRSAVAIDYVPAGPRRRAFTLTRADALIHESITIEHRDGGFSLSHDFKLYRFSYFKQL